MDTITPEVRSRVMSRIRGVNTKPELFIRRGLFARGFRYRINSSSLPGSPDLKLAKYRAVIFVHGCFWHSHGCALFRPPSSNVGYWSAKLARNSERDLEDLEALREAGWRICIVWECAVKRAESEADRGALLEGISTWLEGSGRFIEFSAADSHSEASPRTWIRRNKSVAAYAAERSSIYSSRS